MNKSIKHIMQLKNLPKLPRLSFCLSLLCAILSL
ncbi:unnamed protein product [Brassica rapa subsp. narinosa]